MLVKISIPFLLSFVLVAIQLIVIPLISINGIVPNVLLIYLLFYSLKHGKIVGTIFAFFIGFVFDASSGGLIGSGMFAFTIASFVAGFFQKNNFTEVLKNIKVIIMLIMFSSFLFFFSYSVLGNSEAIMKNHFSYFLFSIFSALYTTLFALSVYIFRWKKL